MDFYPRFVMSIFMLAGFMATTAAYAGQEFPPPQGKGHVVVIASGVSGPEHYATVARDIASLGYDVVLFDGNAMKGTHGDAVQDAIDQSQQMPHGLPGKVVLVGFSSGGGQFLYYGTQSSDQVAGVIVWYPATYFIKNIPKFVGNLKVPVLMLVGEDDTYRNNCCSVDKAHVLADAAKASGLPFELDTYPGTKHDFVKGGRNYNPQSYTDALNRTAAKLKEFFGG
jgi:dienelactone hydrolase